LQSLELFRADDMRILIAIHVGQQGCLTVLIEFDTVSGDDAALLGVLGHYGADALSDKTFKEDIQRPSAQRAVAFVARGITLSVQPLKPLYAMM
jgi:hypothetical protein